METHVRTAGWVLIGMGASFGLIAIIVLIVSGGYDGLLLTDDPFFKRNDIGSIPLDRILAAALVTFSLVMAAPLMIAGHGILKWKPWSRVMGMLVSALHMLHFPLGTAAGIYVLWALNDEATEILFDRTVARR